MTRAADHTVLVRTPFERVRQIMDEAEALLRGALDRDPPRLTEDESRRWDTLLEDANALLRLLRPVRVRGV